MSGKIWQSDRQSHWVYQPDQSSCESSQSQFSQSQSSQLGRVQRRYLACILPDQNSESGVTLIELLVVILMAGILATILAPGWLGMQRGTSLTAAQDELFQAIRQAQSQALATRQTQQIRFRTVEDRIEWAIVTTAASTATSWQSLRPNIQIAPSETTISQTSEMYFVEFNHKGYVTPPFGRLSLAYRQGQDRRCIFVSTLLGVLRKASGQQCYR